MRIYSFESKDKAGKKIKFKKSKGRSFKWNIKTLALWFFRTAAVGIFLFAVLFLYYSKDLPDPGKLVERQVAESTKIYARDNSLLYEIHGEVKRTLVPSEEISEYLKKATIAIEDKDFYKHHGISFTGIGRAVFRLAVNLDRSGGGGSTITQQLVKNAILINYSAWDRKPREVILSVAMETRFTKDEILQMYLNEIPYGKNTYGAEAASQGYFGKHAKDLSLAEAAYLAALPQSPSRYNPFGPNRTTLDGRKNYILQRMREDGYISQEQEKQAKEEKVAFSNIRTSITAPHFVFMVEDYLAEKFGEKTLQEGGLKVYTTLDPKLQKIAEDAVNKYAENNAKKYNANNSSLVAIEPKTGQILALVGSKNYFGTSSPESCKSGDNCLFEPQFNVATAPRQPGSSFKPYVYVTAFDKEHKYAPASMLMDVTTNFGKFNNKDYIPQNYDGSERGPISMRQALAGSLNIPAVKTLALVGVDNATETAKKLGITSPLSNCGLSLVLGGCEVKLVDHTSAYATLANKGVKNATTFILKIQDRSNQIVEEFQNKPQEVLDPQAVYELTDIMSDNNARSYVFGSNSPLTLPGRPVAAKTGTTNDWHDGWTMGFTPSLAAGVWSGNNCGSKNPKCLMKRGADGVIVAAPIWKEFMTNALKDTPVERFERPSGIQEIVVDSVSGKLPTQLTPTTKTEIFASYSIPTEYDDVHKAVEIDSFTGQPATPLTPPNQIIYRTYLVYKSENPKNQNWENAVNGWALKNGFGYPASLNGSTTPTNIGNPPAISINSPEDNSSVFSLPVRIEIAATGENNIARIDISVDGNFIKSINSIPYIFDLPDNYGNGKHTIAAKAVDVTGNSADTSIILNYEIPGNNF
ncbi:MAG: penicillin-binding protein [Candidatus Doudnabacteria bacterium]|nr:penicillin-binding protein [Candidatus Doudnabacteria bacterium]